jgi:hypothetical protein
MFWSDPTSRLALTLRRLRSRLGWESPGVTVRMAWPWYWRAIAIIVLSSISLALAGWIYDAGRKFSGFSGQTSASEFELLRAKVLSLEKELAEARSLADTSASQLQIEKTTQDQLAEQLKRSEDESLKLKADLAMFENFLGNKPGTLGLTISRFRVEPTGEKGKYAFHLFVTQQGADKGREFNGKLQFVVTAHQDGKKMVFDYPEKGGSGAAGLPASVKNFARFDGALKIPENAIIANVEARLVENGAIRARQSLNL